MVADYSLFRLKCNGPTKKNAGKWVENAKFPKKLARFDQKRAFSRQIRKKQTAKKRPVSQVGP
jgi:hypothetical protein